MNLKKKKLKKLKNKQKNLYFQKNKMFKCCGKNKQKPKIKLCMF